MMAIGKWISFSSQQTTVADVQLPKPLPIPCADGKRFGLENFGNTCYANSVLQALYFCPPFRELVIQHTDPYASLQQAFTSHFSPTNTPTSPTTATRRKPEGKDSSPNVVSRSHPPTPPVPSAPRTLFSALRSLYIHISQNPAEKGTVAPRIFIEKLRELNEAFRNTMHQDAHEFLNYLLNRIVEEIEEEKKHRLASGDDLPHSVKSSSSASHPPHLTASTSTASTPSPGATFIHQIFEGTLTSETRCLTCENVSSRDESFLDLSIDIEQNSSLTACLRQFSASEMLCQKEKFFCDACCDLQEAERRMKIKRLPNVLALHLKRFKYQEDVQKYIKLAYRVAFPFELRLFNTVDDIPNPDRLYELFAIVVHIGNGPNHGHYVSIIKTMGRWLIFDDETVDTIKECDIPKYFGESNSGSAYVLYYQAVDIDFVAIGLRPPTPDPVTQAAPQPEPLPSQWQPTDSPVSATQPIPPLPPGLNDDLKGSALVPDAFPQPAAPPSIPTQSPPEPGEKSPRRVPSQFLKVAIGRPHTSQGPTRKDASRRASQTTTDDEKLSSVSKASLSPIALFPKEDISSPGTPSPSVVNGKEKESEKKMMSWLRRKSLKSVKPRPISATNGERSPLPPDLASGSLGSPVQLQSASSSSNSSKDSRLVELTSSAHTSPRPTKQLPHPRLSDELSPQEKGHKLIMPATYNITTSPTSPPPSRRSQPRPLPAIPASPQTPNVEPIPPSSYSKTSTDHNHTRQRHPSIQDLHPSASPRTPARPATSAGTPGPKALPLPPSAPPGGSFVPSPGKATTHSDGRSESPLGRPKSAHASYSLGMLSPLSPSSPPPMSAPVAGGGGTGIKRTKRKLSLSAPMLGFGKRDKDKDKEKQKDKTADRPLSHTLSNPSPSPTPRA